MMGNRCGSEAAHGNDLAAGHVACLAEMASKIVRRVSSARALDIFSTLRRGPLGLPLKCSGFTAFIRQLDKVRRSPVKSAGPP